MKQEIMRALGIYALVSDVDTLGYLGGEELMAAQKARVDWAGQQQRLALEYLHRYNDAHVAKQQLRRDVAEIEADTVNQNFSEEEAWLLERFALALDPEIERLSQKTPSQQTYLRLFLKIPTQIVVLACIAAAMTVVVLIAKMLNQ